MVCPLLKPNQLNPLIFTTFPFLSIMLEPSSVIAKESLEMHPRRRNPKIERLMNVSFSGSFPLTRAALPFIYSYWPRSTHAVRSTKLFKQFEYTTAKGLVHCRQWTRACSVVKDVPCKVRTVEYVVFYFERSKLDQRRDLSINRDNLGDLSNEFLWTVTRHLSCGHPINFHPRSSAAPWRWGLQTDAPALHAMSNKLVSPHRLCGIHMF